MSDSNSQSPIYVSKRIKTQITTCSENSLDRKIYHTRSSRPVARWQTPGIVRRVMGISSVPITFGFICVSIETSGGQVPIVNRVTVDLYSPLFVIIV